MPRLMSFMLTKEQFKNQTKTVTRRLGWDFLKPGDIVIGCEQCQGLAKGQTINKLGPFQVVSTRWQMLKAITLDDVIREGFPDMTPAQFIDFFCQTHRCQPNRPVNRIEFRYLTPAVLAWLLTVDQYQALVRLRANFPEGWWFTEVNVAARPVAILRQLYAKGCLDRRRNLEGFEYRLMV